MVFGLQQGRDFSSGCLGFVNAYPHTWLASIRVVIDDAMYTGLSALPTT
jgi:hypothetical protein